MVHPEDERYNHLIGKMVALPLCGPHHPGDRRRVRGQAFGTGVVKVTPRTTRTTTRWASATACP